MARFTDKIAVVTGASKGIGASIAKRLAAEGASVVVNYASSNDGANQVVDDIVQAGGKAIAIGASVSNEDDVTRLFEEVRKAFGRVDVLVNNAGVYDPKPIESLSLSEFNRHFDTNVLGLLLATKAALPLFPTTGGSIVNISSVVSTDGAGRRRNLCRHEGCCRFDYQVPSKGVRAPEDKGQRRQTRLCRHRRNALCWHGRR